MAHALMQRTHNPEKPNAIDNPFLITMRYQCECTGKEVLQIGVVVDLDRMLENEQAFIWTMKRMLHDMKVERDQHLAR